MQNTIVSIAAIAVMLAVCIVMHIRYKRRTAAMGKSIDTYKQEAQEAREETRMEKEHTENRLKEYH